VFERSEAPFPRLWGPGPAPFPCLETIDPSTGSLVLMFLMCLLSFTVSFCYRA
jgi:hypothetical protein